MSTIFRVVGIIVLIGCVIAFPPILLVPIYFLPSIVHHHRRKVSLTSMIIANTLLGWTIIGWLILLLKALDTSTADQLNAGISVRGISPK